MSFCSEVEKNPRRVEMIAGALWNGIAIRIPRIDEQIIEVSPAALVPGRDGKPLALLCSVKHYFSCDGRSRSGSGDDGYVYYPRPEHAVRYAAQIASAVSFGPAYLAPGCVGAVGISHLHSPLDGATAVIDYLQGAVNFRRLQTLTTGERRDFVQISRHYAHWKHRLAEAAFAHLEASGHLSVSHAIELDHGLATGNILRQIGEVRGWSTRADETTIGTRLFFEKGDPIADVPLPVFS